MTSSARGESTLNSTLTSGGEVSTLIPVVSCDATNLALLIAFTNVIYVAP